MDTFTTDLPEGITLTQPFSTRDFPANEPVFLPAHYALPTVGSTEFDAVTALSQPESELIAAYDLALPFSGTIIFPEYTTAFSHLNKDDFTLEIITSSTRFLYEVDGRTPEVLHAFHPLSSGGGVTFSLPALWHCPLRTIEPLFSEAWDFSLFLSLCTTTGETMSFQLCSKQSLVHPNVTCVRTTASPRFTVSPTRKNVEKDEGPGVLQLVER